jgi:hypothetical protein
MGLASGSPVPPSQVVSLTLTSPTSQPCFSLPGGPLLLSMGFHLSQVVIPAAWSISSQICDLREKVFYTS